MEKSCWTCKYFVPPTGSSYNYPGDPWECTEPKVGDLMTANPPKRKGYCKRWTPKEEKKAAPLIELGLCFGAKKCALCGREFEEGEAKYEVEGLGCLCWDCYDCLKCGEG